MSKSIDPQRKQEMEARRTQFAISKLEAKGKKIMQPDRTKIKFHHKGKTVTLYPFTGWFTGKTVTDGRGIHNLIKQL